MNPGIRIMTGARTCKFAGNFAGLWPGGMTGGARWTGAALACLLAGLLLSPGCAASKSEVREANNSGYSTDFATVYSETLAELRSRYPELTENATIGEIKTAWHQVRITAGNQDPPKTQSPDRQPTLFTAASRVNKRYFIRFTVRVIGGNPWRITIVGQASEWDPATAMPTELKGGDEPHWLEGRTNSLRVAIHERLAKFAVTLPSTATPVANQGKTKDPVAVDSSQFSQLPPGAARVIEATLRASKSRDFTALEATMKRDFQWSLGAPPGARDALVMWQADTSVLDLLAEAIEAGCRADPDGKRVTCPPAYTEQEEFLGHRVGFEQAADGSWLMAFFVSGD